MITVLRILGYFRKYWLATLGAYACLVVVAGVELSVPYLIRQIIDCGIKVGVGDHGVPAHCITGMDSMRLVTWLVFLIVGLTVLKGIFHFGQGYLGAYSAQGIAYDLRSQISRHLQRLSFSWHDRSQTGQLMARATSDVDQLRHFTSRALIQMAHFVFISVGISVVLFNTNWKLALASLVTLPFLSHAASQYGRRVRPLFRMAQQELAVLATFVQENLAGARVVKAFAREQDQIRKFEHQNELLLEQYLAAAKVQAYSNPLMDVFANLSTVIVLWFGGTLVIGGELSVGQLVAFNTYLLLMVRPVRRLGFLIGQTSRAIAAGERIFEVLDAPVEVLDKRDAMPLPAIEGRVEFRGVSCTYYPGAPVLQDVSFAVSPGQVVALLGTTGSGKSTIVNLVPRFYDVTDGSVLVDGHDVRDVQLHSLRRQIGIVMQDTTLFTGTIRGNIAFGAPGATQDEIVSMAKAARAHDFISGFPEGYDTLVGERGITLSGGQKQRIAIARALLLDPKILILDDFTSAVDTETEAMIRSALDVLMKDRTTFIIAQRVSTVQDADKIIILDHGRIVGQGTHMELVENNSIYNEIFQIQLLSGSGLREKEIEPVQVERHS
ncbi:MAG: ATP-binding cassette domain-containing protein [Deltaproteobacteria bacterium]|nr:ATP-binding cassette domain-containing protein [Deltaproteobacteria bacterium]